MMIGKTKTFVRYPASLKALDRKIVYLRFTEDEHGNQALIAFDENSQGWVIATGPRPTDAVKPRPRRPRARKTR